MMRTKHGAECNATRSGQFALAIVALATASCVSWFSCEGPPEDLADTFSRFGEATSIQVCGGICTLEPITIIRDRRKIDAAAEFAKHHAQGWRDSWNGPGGGVVNLYFHKGDQVLGGYGFTRFIPGKPGQVLMSNGKSTRLASDAEVVALLDDIGVLWPSDQ
jgi:hypothetical protein